MLAERKGRDLLDCCLREQVCGKSHRRLRVA
jgi:hypothetical protein